MYPTRALQVLSHRLSFSTLTLYLSALGKVPPVRSFDKFADKPLGHVWPGQPPNTVTVATFILLQVSPFNVRFVMLINTR